MKKKGIENILPLLLIIFCLHFNSVKISVVKISEIILLFYGIVNFGSFSKISRTLLKFFSFFLLITFVHNIFQQFDTSVVTSILQAPYWCSIGRYVELFCCIAFIELCNKTFRKCGFLTSINVILDYNFKLNCFILFFYIVEFFGGIHIFNLISQGYRLQGFFVEGGPFGLYTAMMLSLSIFFKRPIREHVVLMLCLIASFSKAGILCLVISLFVAFLFNAKYSPKYRTLLFILFIPLTFFALIVVNMLMEKYMDRWVNSEDTEIYAMNNPNDYSFVAGRIAGKYIGFEMIKHNPLIGIGLGNYPISRNLNEYRLFFPQIPIYDATGLGGIFDLLIQGGIVILLIFIVVLKNIYRQSCRKQFIIYFVLCFLCGVQLTFVYPWMLIALGIKKDTFSCVSPSIAVSPKRAALELT